MIAEGGSLPGTSPASLTYVFDAHENLLVGVQSDEGDLPDLESMRAALDGKEDFRDASYDDDSRVLSVPVIMDGELIGVVQVGRSVESQREFIGLLWRLLIGTGVLAMVVAAGGGVFLASRAMRPIRQAFERQRGFIADASHELRGPVAVVRADADALTRSLVDIPDTDAQLLRDMQAEADHIAVLIDRLVELARLDAMQVEPVIEPFDLNQLAENAVRAARTLAGDRDVEIRLSEGVPGPITVLADQTHIRVVFLSLLENAIVHGGEPNTITVGVEAAGDSAWVLVDDTGRGMPSAQADRVFDRFYRGDPARTRNDGGGGLGLSIARSLIEINGGQIELDSDPGAGVTVRFSLPRSFELPPSP